MSAAHDGLSHLAAETRIAVRAYDKWRTRCGSEDRQLQDWLEAEVELTIIADLTQRLSESQIRLTSLCAERLHAERQLVTESAVAKILARCETLADAAPNLVHALCENLDWDAGALWVVDRSANLLRCLAVWHSPAADLHDFERGCLSARFAPGVGLPGRAWTSGSVVWTPDLTAQADCPRKSCAADAGLHAAIAFPIFNGIGSLGVLELFSREVRLPDGVLTQMTSLSNQIGEFIKHRATEAHLREQEHDRRVGREIQRALLPRAIPQLPGFVIAGRSLAANDVGGDCFDFLPLGDVTQDRLGVFVADASGHGIGPALLTGQTRAYLRALALTCADIDQLLKLTNTRLAIDAVSDHFVTAILLSLEPRTRTLHYTSAGHIPGYLLTPQGQTKAVFPSTDIPLGIDLLSEFPASGPVVMEPGDLVLLLTDGIVEAASPSGELFGPERALAIVRQQQQQPPDEILKALFDAASAFCAQELLDDLTAVIIKCDETT